MLNSVRAYRNNPLIRAVGPTIRSYEEWEEALTALPPIADEERDAPPQYRFHSVADLDRIFIPRPNVVELAMHLDWLLRQGYVNRNPVAGQRERILSAIPSTKDDMKTLVERAKTQRITSSTLVGISGIGKSLAVDQILSTIPQVVFHEHLGIWQVTYLKIDLPSDGSTRHLALAFIYALEEALGAKLPIKVSDRTSANELLLHMIQYAAVYSVGLLVIDEVQNLTAKKSQGREVMLNVIQEICNTIHVPLFLIGTLKAMKLLTTEARNARRVAAYGAFVWDRLDAKHSEWNAIVDVFWQYQWTAKHDEFTQEISDSLYNATQGVFALLPTVLMLAQQRAILTGREIVDLKTLEWVYKNRLKPVHPMLDALRSKDPRRLINFEDLWMPNFLEAVRREQYFEERKGNIAAFKPPKDLPPGRRAAMSLSQEGFEMGAIKDAISRVESERGRTSTAQIVIAARKLLIDVEPEAEPVEGDLRYADAESSKPS